MCCVVLCCVFPVCIYVCSACLFVCLSVLVPVSGQVPLALTLVLTTALLRIHIDTFSQLMHRYNNPFLARDLPQFLPKLSAALPITGAPTPVGYKSLTVTLNGLVPDNMKPFGVGPIICAARRVITTLFLFFFVPSSLQHMHLNTMGT